MQELITDLEQIFYGESIEIGIKNKIRNIKRKPLYNNRNV